MDVIILCLGGVNPGILGENSHSSSCSAEINKQIFLFKYTTKFKNWFIFVCLFNKFYNLDKLTFE